MTNDNNWSPCEHGTLQSLSADLRAEDRQRRVSRRTAVAGLVAVAAGGVLITERILNQEPEQIACSAVHENAEDYAKGIADSELTERIDSHRKHCQSCDQFLRSLEA